MKVSSLSELKRELQHLSEKELSALCLALAKYKKDNKEFLDYLLFHSEDKREFVNEVKSEMDIQFGSIDPYLNLYYSKKSLRKIQRLMNKYCKYLADKALVVELHLHFCTQLKDSGIPFRKSQQLINLYEKELSRIQSLISTLHEDLQADYSAELESLRLNT